MFDFLIVGGGIAGICFAEIAKMNGKSFAVVTDDSQNSSVIAAGLYNPVILKRFSMPEDAKKHLEFMKPFYQVIEKRLGIIFDNSISVYRRFASIEEQNNWFIAADKPKLSTFILPEVIANRYKYINAPYGFGQVLYTGYIDTIAFLMAYHNELLAGNQLVNERFIYSELIIDDNYITYKDCKAKHIIFAEGFGITANPLFNYLPLDGTKGELLIISAPELKLDVSVNSGIFILPLGNDLYKVGATYEWDDKTATATEKGRIELIQKLEEIVLCDYTIINHYAGIRPTVKDRKPLIGTHPIHKNVHLLNGLGTRGVMLGPSMALELYNAIEHSHIIQRSNNLDRFKFKH